MCICAGWRSAPASLPNLRQRKSVFSWAHNILIMHEAMGLDLFKKQKNQQCSTSLLTAHQFWNWSMLAIRSDKIRITWVKLKVKTGSGYKINLHWWGMFNAVILGIIVWAANMMPNINYNTEIGLAWCTHMGCSYCTCDYVGLCPISHYISMGQIKRRLHHIWVMGASHTIAW